MGLRDATELHGWPDEDDLDRLRRNYPQWRIWRGMTEQRQPSGWYATRRNEITDADIDRGMHRTVDADTAERLRELLDEQMRIAEAAR
jgi:hypothetical protein